MILKPITTEKAIGGIELRNAITFQIEPTDTKKSIKEEIEKEYGFKVKSVNTLTSPNGMKKAVITFKEKGKAADLAAKLKLV
ncbi:MAG: 50S ribosomal protein L23 [Candidatus Micrarchaeota archaeon]